MGFGWLVVGEIIEKGLYEEGVSQIQVLKQFVNEWFVVEFNSNHLQVDAFQTLDAVYDGIHDGVLMLGIAQAS